MVSVNIPSLQVNYSKLDFKAQSGCLMLMASPPHKPRRVLRLLCVCAHLMLGRGLLLRGPTSRPVIRGRRAYPPRMDTSEDLATEVSYTVTLLSSIRDVKRKDWDALALPADSPFVEWDWLHALEASGCACAETGWTPYHLVVCSPGTTKLVAAMPLYLKSHSMGDFVDDQQWADEARQGGANYYPKLVSAVPFTPCQGSRVLMSEALSSGVQAQVCIMPLSCAALESLAPLILRGVSLAPRPHPA